MAIPNDKELAIQAFKAAVGENVFVHRMTAGLSQRALAARAGISAGHLSVIERGVADVRLLTLERIGIALGASAAELLDIDGSEFGLTYRNTRAGLLPNDD